jgi:hypothetical protein
MSVFHIVIMTLLVPWVQLVCCSALARLAAHRCIGHFLRRGLHLDPVKRQALLKPPLHLVKLGAIPLEPHVAYEETRILPRPPLLSLDTKRLLFAP